MAVQLIIDAGCDLNLAQAQALGVFLIPMTIRFCDEEFRAGVDLSHEEFYNKLTSTRELPTTSQPTPYDYEQVYQQVKNAGDEAVVLCVSSALSGTYQSAVIASADFKDCVYVVDTRAVSLAQKILLDYAISLQKHGATAKEIAAELEKKKADVCAYGAVDTLEYLIKGGRLSKAAGAVGSVLGIRPVLYLCDGGLAVAGKARGPKAAIAMTHNLVAEVGVDYSMPVAVGYTGNDSSVLAPYLEAHNSVWTNYDVPIYNVGSTVGTHTGPGLFITAFFKKS
jgi:DegV family protein with EDD domain